jgi:hypothetical protein
VTSQDSCRNCGATESNVRGRTNQDVIAAL